MEIHETGEGWIFFGQGKKPGRYDDKRTAQYAAEFSNEELQQLQNNLGQYDEITYEMLQELKRKREKKP